MSVTTDTIRDLYRVRPADTWERELPFDFPREHGLVPHQYSFARDRIFSTTNMVRHAIGVQIAIVTVPDEHAAHEPERPAVIIRREPKLLLRDIAEINDGAEHDPRLMRANTANFLAQGSLWEAVMLRHLTEWRDDLAVLLGERTVYTPKARIWDLRTHVGNLIARIGSKVTPEVSAGNNIRVHWLWQKAMEGVTAHFEESHHNAVGGELQDGTGNAVELAKRLAQAHLAASEVAYQKLAKLRERADGA